MTLTAIAINASLKASGGEPSSTDFLLSQLSAALAEQGIPTTETIRLVDHDIKPGVTSDEGEGDAWPAIRRKILDANILLFGLPIWLGQPSSVAKRVLERMDAFLGEADDKGRMPSFGRVVGIAVVGNEDGAHHVTAELCQALNDLGFTIPAAAATYWVGEAMGKTDYKDLATTPENTAQATKMAAVNLAHLARLLDENAYPGVA